MAGIDKIYVTKEQFKVLYEWNELLEKEGLWPKDMPFNQYNLDLKDLGTSTYPVWNLGHKEDMILLSYCPFRFVTDQLLEMYGWDTEGGLSG